MIAYLPDIYPDELIYSWFCRYYVHSGCISSSVALKDILSKRCNNPSKEFIGHINSEMQNNIHKLFSVDDLIINHTMFPQYARFISLEEKKRALFHMGKDFKDAHHLFSILPRCETDKFLKFCPLCAKEDRNSYGETYWHRQHQIRDMQVCTKHKCKLQSSKITAKSEQTFTFCPAEININIGNIEIISDTDKLNYADYVIKVFKAPIDLKTDIPICAVIYKAMKNTKYLKSSGKTRNTKKLAENIDTFYKKIGLNDIASIYQIQRTVLGERFDFSVICQIAYFLNIGIEDLTSPNISRNQIIKEHNTHYMKNKKPINWIKFDEETAPILKDFAKGIYDGTANANGRPDRVSERIVYREMNLPKHRLDNLPKCRAIFEHFTESYEETWARRIIWAYNNLKSKNQNKICWTDIRKLSGVKKKNIDAVIPYLKKYTDIKTVNSIMAIIKNAPTAL